MLQVIPGFGFYADRRGIHDPDGKDDERFGRLSGTERISLRPIQPEQTVLRIDTRRNHLPGLLETRLRFTEPVNVQISVSQIAQRFRRFPHMGMINREYAQAIAIPPVQIKMPAVFPHETGMIDHVRETVFHPVQALFGRRPHIILQTVGSAFVTPLKPNGHAGDRQNETATPRPTAGTVAVRSGRSRNSPGNRA